MASASVLLASSEGLVATSGQYLTLADLKQSPYYQCYLLKSTGRILHTIHPIEQFWLKRLSTEEQSELRVQVTDTMNEWRTNGLEHDEWRILQTRARLNYLLASLPTVSGMLDRRNDKHSVHDLNTHIRKASDSLNLSEASDEELESAAGFYGSSADMVGSRLGFFTLSLEDTPEARKLESRCKLQSQLPMWPTTSTQNRTGASIHLRAMDNPLLDALSETSKRSSLKSESYFKIPVSNCIENPTTNNPSIIKSKSSEPKTSVSVLPRGAKGQSCTKSDKRSTAESSDMAHIPPSGVACHSRNSSTWSMQKLSGIELSYSPRSPIPEAMYHRATEPDTEVAFSIFDKQVSPAQSRLPSNSFDLLDKISLSWSFHDDNIPSASDTVRAANDESTIHQQRSFKDVGYALATSSKIDITLGTQITENEEDSEDQDIQSTQSKSGFRVHSQEPINLSFIPTERLDSAALERSITEDKISVQKDRTISGIGMITHTGQAGPSLSNFTRTQYSSTLREATKAQLSSVAIDSGRNELSDNNNDKGSIGTLDDDDVESEESEFHDARDHFETLSHTPEYNLDDFVAPNTFGGGSNLTNFKADEDEAKSVSINVDAIHIIVNVPYDCVPHIVVDGKSIDLTYVSNPQNDSQKSREAAWLYYLVAVSYLVLVVIVVCAPMFIKPTRARAIETADAADMNSSASGSLKDLCHWTETFNWTYMCSIFSAPNPFSNTTSPTSEILDSSKALKGSLTSIANRIDGKVATRTTIGTAIMLYLASIVVFAQRLQQVQLHH